MRPAIATTPPAPAAMREATGLHVACAPRNPQETALTGVLTGLAVDFAIKGVETWLKSLREGRNAGWSAATALPAACDNGGEGYRVSLWRGTIEASGAETRGEYRAAFPEGMEVRFREHPAFLLNMTLRPLSGGEGEPARFVLTPQSLVYGETAAPRRGKNRKNVVVMFALTPAAARAGEDGRPDIGEATMFMQLDLGRLEVGRSYGAALLATAGSSANADPDNPPASATAVVLETEESTIALDSALSAFEDNKGDLAEALKAVVSEALGASGDSE